MTAGLSFRRALAGDVASIVEITRAAYSKWIEVIGREPLPMSFDYNQNIARHQIELAIIGDEVVGLIEMVANPDHILIENLAVSPDLQRAGIGAGLLQHAEEMARGQGVTQMRLYTNQLFTSNINFYFGRGYTVEREEPFRGGVIVHMFKSLI